MELRTPRGTRDFMPSEMERRERVFSIIRNVYERYGFRPLGTPAFEEMEVLTAKCGEDVSKQIYGISDSSYGLRFDLTVPLARVIASNTSIPKPFKRYQIGPVWRRDEPQKGRFREFWQADIDIVGSASMLSEVEVIAAACEALSELGFSGFEVRLNNRKLLNAFVENTGIPKESVGAVFRALDKLEKIGVDGVKSELREKAGLTDNKILDIMAFTSINGDNTQKLEAVLRLIGGNASGMEGISELKEIIGLFNKYEISRKCSLIIDFSLVRGLDYYTGPIFEVKLPEGVIGGLSIAAGGRYDNLIQLYGAPPTPATGISLGVERILEAIKKQEVEERRDLVFVATVKPDFLDYAIKVVQELRKAGIRAEMDLMGRNLRKQLDYANAIGARFVAVVGEKEAKEQTLTLRDFSSGKEETCSLPDAIKRLE